MNDATLPRPADPGAASDRPSTPESANLPAPVENPRDVKIFTWAVVILGIAILAGLSVLVARTRLAEVRAGETFPTKSRSLIGFRLTDRTGRPVNRTELSGKYVVVNFVFTSCSLPCLEVNRQMAEIQRQVADQPEVLLVSLSLDPRTDSPPVLAKFADRFGADTNRWLFLTGEKDEMYGLLGASFLDPAPPGIADLLPGGFDHTDQIALVDPAGKVRRYFDGLRAGAAPAVLKAIEELRKERR